MGAVIDPQPCRKRRDGGLFARLSPRIETQAADGVVGSCRAAGAARCRQRHCFAVKEKSNEVPGSTRSGTMQVLEPPAQSLIPRPQQISMVARTGVSIASN